MHIFYYYEYTCKYCLKYIHDLYFHIFKNIYWNTGVYTRRYPHMQFDYLAGSDDLINVL